MRLGLPRTGSGLPRDLPQLVELYVSEGLTAVEHSVAVVRTRRSGGARDDFLVVEECARRWASVDRALDPVVLGRLHDGPALHVTGVLPYRNHGWPRTGFLPGGGGLVLASHPWP